MFEIISANALKKFPLTTEPGTAATPSERPQKTKATENHINNEHTESLRME